MIVKPRSNRKPFYVTLSVILVLLLAGLAYSYKNNLFFFKDDPSADNADTINLDPPTEEDKQEAESNKKRLIEEEEKANDSPTTEVPQDGKQAVKPLFGYLRQADDLDVEANGYITSTIESNGVCTLTLKKAEREITKSKQAMPDAQSTVCGLITIERGQLSVGKWEATITYSSEDYHGVSETRVIEVK